MTSPDLPTFGTAAPDDLDEDLAPMGDPDELAPIGAVDETSDAETIAAELDEEVLKTVDLAVPGRPRYAVRYRLDFTDKDLDTWSRQAGDKGYRAKISGTKFALIGLASTCVGILRDGELVELDGKPATFRSRTFLSDVLKVPTAILGVRKLYGGVEGNVDAAMRRVMVAAGWGDDADEATSSDPT